MHNPVGKRRDKQKAETRSLILESARKLFEKDGFEKTTIRAVAFHAQIALGTIYKHFENKTELLAAAFIGDLERLRDSAFGTMPEDTGFKQQFMHVAKHFYAYYCSRPLLTKAYLTNLFALEEQGFSQINAFDEAYLDDMARLAAKAQARGEIDKAKDSRYVAMSVLADYFFVILTCFLRAGPPDLAEMLGMLEKLIDQTVS